MYTERKSQYLGWHLPADTSLIGVDVDLYSGGIKFAKLDIYGGKNTALDRVTMQAVAAYIAIHHV